jgi:hypothetical protein
MTAWQREKTKMSKDFYPTHYRRNVNRLLYCAIVIIVLIAGLMYVVLNRKEPVYYATSSDGGLVHLQVQKLSQS